MMLTETKFRSNEDMSPSRKIGPIGSLFKLPPIELGDHHDIVDIKEDQDFVSKEIHRRKTLKN